MKRFIVEFPAYRQAGIIQSRFLGYKMVIVKEWPVNRGPAGMFSRALLFSLMVSPFFLRCSFSEELKSPVHLQAEYLEYDKEAETIYSSGHAVLTSEGLILEADEIFYNIQQETLIARGHVQGRDGTQYLSGYEVAYDLKTKKGELSLGKIYSYHWYISGPRMERYGPEKMYLPIGSFTTCDLDHPHYQIKAKKISVYPKKYVVCYHALFYIGDTPFLYLPVYYQSLRRKKYSLTVYIGHNSTEGDFVKTIYGYPLSENTYGRLYLDYMEYLGWGKGLQYEYNFPDRLIGSCYYYYIHQRERRIKNQDPLLAPDVPEAKRWNANFSHWQRFNPTWMGQASVAVLSDQSFNRCFNEEEWRKINNDITSFAAATKLEKNYTFRIVGERRDLWHMKKEGFEEDGYLPEYMYAPRASFITNQIRLPWSYSRRVPFYFNANFESKRSYLYYAQDQAPQQRYYYNMWDGNGQFSISNRLNLTRIMSLTPRLGVAEYWQDKTVRTDETNIKFIDTRNSLQTQCFTNLNLRTRLTSFMDWDLGHTYVREIWARPVEPQGVVQKMATTAVELRFSRTVKKAKEIKPEVNEYPWRKTERYVFTKDSGNWSRTDLLKSELAFYSKVFNEEALLRKYLNSQQVQGSYKTQLLRLRSSTSYNLIHNNLPEEGEIRFKNSEERFSNLVNTLTLTPFAGLSVTVTEEGKLQRNAQQERIFVNQRLASQMDLSLKQWTVGLIANYVKGDVVTIDEQPLTGDEQPRYFAKIDLQNNIGFWLAKKWKIDFHTRFNLAHDRWRIMDTKLVERGASVYRDLHCWEVVFSWNKFAFEEEAWLHFNLKALPDRKIGFYHSQRTSGTILEEEWNIRRK